ncbi:MAG: hypothetical protein IPK96_07570 [Flammeovirgaceae bacterium]|nr:hypothetical protein [Flammeovirgaceae bacterium]
MCYRNLVPILFIVSIFSCSQDAKTPESLFNGKDLTGWDTYLGPIYDSVKGDFDPRKSLD